MSNYMEPEETLDITNLARRRMVWDTVPCDAVLDTFESLDLILGSQDGIDMEHRRSHARLNSLAPLQNQIALFAGLAGEAIAHAILNDRGYDSDEFDDEDIERYRTVVRSGVFGTLANLVDLGYLTMNPFAKGLRAL